MIDKNNLKNLFITFKDSRNLNTTRPCLITHGRVSYFYVSNKSTTHGRVEQTHGRVSFTESIPSLCMPVSLHAHTSTLAHARASNPHGRVSLQKSPCLGFLLAINSHHAPRWQTSIISFKIHQICPHHSSKYVELLCKLSVYQTTWRECWKKLRIRKMIIGGFELG